MDENHFFVYNSQKRRSALWTLQFDRGTLVLKGREELPKPLCFFQWDPRVNCFRAEAYHYRKTVEFLHRQKIPYRDEAKQYEKRCFSLWEKYPLRDYQQKALRAWQETGKGYIVLPTGAGKTRLALSAIQEVGRDTLVVVPTLDLMHQWYHLLWESFGFEPGLLGGGSFEVKEITVATYDSALRHMEHLGGRFGFLIFDECHHLPAESYSLAAIQSIAPFRLGLTATPERADGREVLLDELIGPCAYRLGVRQLIGHTLSDYTVRRIYLELLPEERKEYEKARGEYLRFLRRHKISLKESQGWQKFLILSQRTDEGRKAFCAYLRQKQIVQASRAKLDFLEHLLWRHHKDRILIFTSDNATVYEISKTFLLPAITHKTPVKERKILLDYFRQGQFHALVTSRVLNEGIDLPEANVGVVLSGSASVREHVQRLGRLLRKREGKLALLYELITKDSSEVSVSLRRGQHEAYEWG